VLLARCCGAALTSTIFCKSVVLKTLRKVENGIDSRRPKMLDHTRTHSLGKTQLPYEGVTASAPPAHAKTIRSHIACSPNFTFIR